MIKCQAYHNIMLFIWTMETSYVFSLSSQVSTIYEVDVEFRDERKRQNQNILLVRNTCIYESMCSPHCQLKVLLRRKLSTKQVCIVTFKITQSIVECTLLCTVQLVNTYIHTFIWFSRRSIVFRHKRTFLESMQCSWSTTDISKWSTCLYESAMMIVQVQVQSTRNFSETVY